MAPRPKAGCFHLLVCAGPGRDDGEDEDLAAVDAASVEESKAISDKSRWSFRRRSTRHRNFKNTETSEADMVSSNKGISEVGVNNNCSPQYSYCGEKSTDQENTNECVKSLSSELLPVDETPSVLELPSSPCEPPAEVRSSPDEHISEVSITTLSNFILEEQSYPIQHAVEERKMSYDEIPVDTAVIVIQSSVRMLMARRVLENYRRFVRLQAAIRGHLVRRRAYDTLRCLMAIIKFQELVRSHKTQLLIDRPFIYVENSSQAKADSHRNNAVHVSSRNKLLANAFVHKIMENGPSLETIRTKCDVTKSDPVWRWLETWTALVPPFTGKHLLASKESSKLEDTRKASETIYADNVISCDPLVEEKVERMECNETATKSLCLEVLVGNCSNKQGNQDEKCLAECDEVIIEHVESATSSAAADLFPDKTSMQFDQTTNPGPSDVNESQSNEHSFAPELTDIETKKLSVRKPCNPAFSAAQSKFEEMSASSFIARPAGCSNWDSRSKQNQDNMHLLEEVSNKNNDGVSLTENSITICHSKILTAASECGTEISVSSTLNSPGRSENEGSEIVIEIGLSEDKRFTHANADCHTGRIYVEKSDDLAIPLSNAEQENDVLDDKHVSANEAAVEHSLEDTTKEAALSDQIGDLTETPAKVPVDGTPRSQATFSDPCDTPSVNTKKSKRENSIASHTRRPSLSVKQSSSSPKSYSAGRGSTENLHKDSKKQESSLRVANDDYADSEPRISSSTPLPSYMQSTESARAKTSAIVSPKLSAAKTSAIVSPKLSADVRESLSRKRMSAPLSNGRQDSSPHLRRSSSQAAQASKVNSSQNSAGNRLSQ